MLKHLYISNYALIDELDIDFPAGFSVITGETGAGKSIILGALGMILGNRADIKAIKPGAKKCVIEAVFDVTGYGLEPLFADGDVDFDASECIVRRELSATGKSRSFVNDTPVALQFLRQLGDHLVDIHSQHQNLLLQKEDFQLGVVDIIAHDEKQKADYASAYADYRKAVAALDDLKERIEKTRQNEEFVRFQFNELQSAQLADGMQEELEQESAALSHAEDIKTALFNANDILNADDAGVVGRVGEAADALHSIEGVYPKVKELAARLDTARIELADIAADVDNDSDNIEFDSARLFDVNAMLDKIYSLQQKHHVDNVAALIAIRDELGKQLESIDDSDTQLTDYQHRVDETAAAARRAATVLTGVRRKAAAKVEVAMKSRLVPLGMVNVRFKVDIQAKDLAADGADRVVFLFSANKSTELMPVAEVASGGEIARVMLSLKAMISGAVNLPTIIFDEIDTGVSGAIATKMALLMKEMADAGRQVVAITHLPQIAAMGEAHYKVEKEETDKGTISHMRRLDDKERLTAVAAMLSGDNITPAALENAKELLAARQ
ncbi:DNA repair protein RecN [Prevotella lacticifex]|uniref:DNA repair protein RecN n=1 Tax=Prevotella lacticifex TaxID=2854755 RepID=A0A9R1CV98_9BACT|nr:DNA repair protein RecN [Prevotella lacticifex]GJG37562.1 DNA repair protein RecN [Prevotella lacticifex]GJG40745.1 DNA repair protein RecN [Prevotella lacticifex]GJG43315.1 DNA repair protein RecN [Prevotella lacticifex]GJG47124.1 DNA repair protein RecN [Prevotella lacticifex]GJG50252.1 DNA repair protein RecN [Prevotella lacticifex]